MGTEPQLRKPVPLPPATHVETWANAALVSANPNENALSFRTRFYSDATGVQPDYAKKVQLVVSVAKLQLTSLEERRLLAVANRQYIRRRHELLFTCDLHADTARNKAELRAQLGRLLADARENAEAHALTPDSELPLAWRSRPWMPRDRRAYKKKPNRTMRKASKTPG